MKTTLAIELSKIVHDKCKDVPHDIGLILADKVENKLKEEMIKEIDVEIKKYMGTSTHGSCYTCQRCKNHYDDCECENIYPLEELKKRLSQNAL